MTDACSIDVSALRASLRWSQKRLAACLGCDQATIGRIENGGSVTGPMALLLARLEGLAARHALAGMSVAEVQTLLVERIDPKPSPVPASA